MSVNGLDIDEIHVHDVDSRSDCSSEDVEAIDRINSTTACINPGSSQQVPLENRKASRQCTLGVSKSRRTPDLQARNIPPFVLLGVMLAVVIAFLLGVVVGFASLGVIRTSDGEACHVDKAGHLVNMNGEVVQTSSADTIVASDGTLRVRDGRHANTSNRLVAADRLESWSTLVDLPGQTLYFLERLRRISLYMDDKVHMFSVSGFKWVNRSYMELELSQGRILLIAGGKAFLRDLPLGKIKHATTPANEPQCGRRLNQESLYHPRVYTWMAIVERYRQESFLHSRHLSIESDEFLHMLEWFGALISSEVAVEEAQAQAEQAVSAAYCDFNSRGLECDAYATSLNPHPPILSPTGLMRFTVRESSDAYRDIFGDTMMFYIDMSDWVLGKSRRARHKIASRLTVPTGNSSNESFPAWIDVIEVGDSKAFRYELPHPSAWPEMYGLEDNNRTNQADRGLALAVAALESEQHTLLKSNCQAEAFHPDSESFYGSPALHADSAHFNCTTGTFTWDIGGWRVETSANGTILAFLAVDADNPERPMRFVVESVADGNDDEDFPGLARAFDRGWIFNGCHIRNQSARVDDESRRLDFLQDASKWMSGTNWCGKGTDWVNTVCPTPTNSDDYDADRACRRHDHCARYEDAAFFSRLACSCDKDLNDFAWRNVAVSAVYGAWGLSRKWGCFSKGWHRRWGNRRRYFWHVETVFGEHVRYGWDRYNGKLHDYGYSAKPKACPEDLF